MKKLRETNAFYDLGVIQHDIDEKKTSYKSVVIYWIKLDIL